MFAKNKMVLALAIFAATTGAHAAVTGGQSYNNGTVHIGTSDYPNTAAGLGKAGIKVDGQVSNKTAAISHFAMAPFKDASGAYNFSGREIVGFGAPSSGPADHSKLGVWSFAQVGTQDVWFGEWDAESTTAAVGTKVAGQHTVWYNGENGNVATTLPTTAPVTYAVKSINNYSGGALATSTLTANFATKTASSTGDISFTSGTISTAGSNVNLAANSVNVASASGTGGTLQGQFYGTGASAVAGIVTFSDRTKDTAFGGAKN